MINFVCSSIKNYIAFYPDDLKVKWQGVLKNKSSTTLLNCHNNRVQFIETFITQELSATHLSFQLVEFSQFQQLSTTDILIYCCASWRKVMFSLCYFLFLGVAFLLKLCSRNTRKGKRLRTEQIIL